MPTPKEIITAYLLDLASCDPSESTEQSSRDADDLLDVLATAGFVVTEVNPIKHNKSEAHNKNCPVCRAQTELPNDNRK